MCNEEKSAWQPCLIVTFGVSHSFVVNNIISFRKFLFTISGVGLKRTSTAHSLWKDSA